MCYVLLEMVFCYQNCSDLLWEKTVLVIEKNLFWDNLNNLFKQWKVRTWQNSVHVVVECPPRLKIVGVCDTYVFFLWQIDCVLSKYFVLNNSILFLVTEWKVMIIFFSLSLSASLFLTRSCDHNLSKSTLICMVEDAHLCWHITVGQKWSSWVMTFATWQLGNSIFSDQLPPPFNDGQ